MRRAAGGNLDAIACARTQKEIYPGVVKGLQEAMGDPEPVVRRVADRYRKALGLIPRQPGDPILD